MKVRIYIQSISDIITNSSSELFCTISGPKISDIYDILSPLFLRKCCDISPTLDIEDDTILLSLPYDDNPEEFYKEGLKAILDKYFKDNYKIEFE